MSQLEFQRRGSSNLGTLASFVIVALVAGSFWFYTRGHFKTRICNKYDGRQFALN
jgi:hypothetical protein